MLRCSQMKRLGRVLSHPFRTIAYRLRRLTAPIPFSQRLLNFIVQRIFGLNREIPFSVHFTSRVAGDKLEVDPSSRTSFAVSGGCYIQCINGVKIGEGTIFAPGVRIISANHALEEGREGWDVCRPIEIGDHVWLASNVTVCPGVHIGDWAIVGANSVVTHDVPAHAIVGGVPAKIIRFRTCS